MEVWVDTDMGADDLLALHLLGHHARIAGVSLCFGVATLEQVRRNASGALTAFGWEFPVFAGARSALSGDCHTAEAVLGPAGMRSRGRILPRCPDRVRESAVEAICGWLVRQEHAAILALGPLTNLARLVRARPDLLARIGRVTWMGGGMTRGNHTRWAEFNAFADPEALAVLLDCGVSLRMVDLDACRQIEVTGEDVAALLGQASPGGADSTALLADLLGGYVDIALERGRAAMALYDPVAAAAVVRPDLFTFEPAEIGVALSDDARRGRTKVIAGRSVGANAEIITSLHAEAVRGLCMSPLGVAG